MGRRGYQLLLEEISIVRLDIAIIALISTEHYSCERTTCPISSETVRSCSRQQSISFTAHDEPFDRIPLVAEDELVSPSGEVKPAACMQLCVENRWIDLERILPLEAVSSMELLPLLKPGIHHTSSKHLQSPHQHESQSAAVPLLHSSKIPNFDEDK